MNVVLSYSGGVSRGEFLARSLAADGDLLCFHQPRMSNFTKETIARRLWKESPATCSAHRFINVLNRATKRKPTKRYLTNKITDALVSRELKQDGNLFVGESGICLKSLQRAKNLGYTTFPTYSFRIISNSVGVV